MSEDQDLMARIGHLAGHINLHKTQNTRGSHMTGIAKNRVAGFSVPRNRSYERARQPKSYTHKNKSLVFKKDIHSAPHLDITVGSSVTPAETSQSDHDSSSVPTNIPTKWVAKRDRHMQLINSNVYDNNVSDQSPITQPITIQTNDVEEMTVEQSRNGSYNSANQSSLSALTNAIQRMPQSRVSDPKLAARNDKTQPFQNIAAQATRINAHNSYNKTHRLDPARLTKAIPPGPRKINERCKRFALTGRCAKGSRCLYAHDPTCVALCKDFLQKGLCPAGDFCDLSHDLSPERTPTCLHFLRGRCANPSCRYAHVGLNPAALVCYDFATFGYCKKGAQCSDRHVHECPAYANTGICDDKKCRLPHPDSAGQIRQHQGKSSTIAKSAVAERSPIGGSIGGPDPSGQEEDDHDNSNDETNLSQPKQSELQTSADQQFLSQQDFVHF